MAKLDIDIILIDESVVKNGFRSLMSGAELDTFIANPVMLYLHLRGNEGLDKPTSDILLPVGKWYDIRVDGDKLLAKPDFDDEDEFAKKIEGKVKRGYLKGASIWIDPIAVSDDENLMLAGQRGPTITKWGILEASIVDIPNCINALAIKNSAGKKIILSGTEDKEVIDYLKTFIKTQNTISDMERKLLCANLGLPETATDAEVNAKLSAVTTAANSHTQLSAENATLKAETIRLKKEAGEKKITDMVDGAITAMKLAAGERDNYIKLATADFDTTKAVIDAMKPYESIENKLSGNISDADKAELDGLLKLSGEQLYEQDKLTRLKELSESNFKLKYKEAFGVEFKG